MSKAAELAAYQAGLKTALIEFTDGDDAITIADAGVVTLLTTAVAKSEGGAVTTSIAQGLAKTWVNIDGTGTIAARDSLNVGSLTDNGTGKYDINFTNNFGNTNYCMVVGGFGGSGIGSNYDISLNTTAESNVRAYAGGYYDADPLQCTASGDLA